MNTPRLLDQRFPLPSRMPQSAGTIERLARNVTFAPEVSLEAQGGVHPRYGVAPDDDDVPVASRRPSAASTVGSESEHSISSRSSSSDADLRSDRAMSDASRWESSPIVGVHLPKRKKKDIIHKKNEQKRRSEQSQHIRSMEKKLMKRGLWISDKLLRKNNSEKNSLVHSKMEVLIAANACLEDDEFRLKSYAAQVAELTRCIDELRRDSRAAEAGDDKKPDVKQEEVLQNNEVAQLKVEADSRYASQLTLEHAASCTIDA